MKPSHVINLTAAWEPAGDRVAGWVRRFGGPSGVTAAHRLWIAIEDADPRVTAILNDRPLPPATVHADDADGGGRRPTLRWEITGIVASRNTLIIGAPGALAREPSAGVAGDAVTGDARTRRTLPAAIAARVLLEIDADVDRDASLDTRR
jgi:hypothetical protein